MGPRCAGGVRPLSATDTNRKTLPTRVAAVLAAAEIPASKLGRARGAGLDETERELYLWILRRFATAGRPTLVELRRRSEQLDLARALASFRRDDLVHLGSDGEIAVAYPFSGAPTAHRVRFPDGNTVFAMCAIDALGIAPMFDRPIEIASRDPLSSDAVTVRLEPDGTGAWQPESATVVAGVSERQADARHGCCPVLNFFADDANAERWLETHAHVRGHVISIDDAIAAGRAVFGDVFERA